MSGGSSPTSVRGCGHCIRTSGDTRLGPRLLPPNMASLKLVLLAGAAAALTGCAQTLTHSDVSANAELRASLRKDAAYQLIPPEVRAGMREFMPAASGFGGPEVGLNGFAGMRPNAVADPASEIGDWDGRLQAVGWKPIGGHCGDPADAAHREIGGAWVKKISGRWAFFLYQVAGEGESFAMFIRPLA